MIKRFTKSRRCSHHGIRTKTFGSIRVCKMCDDDVIYWGSEAKIEHRKRYGISAYHQVVTLRGEQGFYYGPG
jgi:hypothetical protein